MTGRYARRVSDIFEFALALNLRDDLSDAELADLRWHLGLGPQPENLAILTAFPVVVVDDNGRPQVHDEPRAILAQRGSAWKVGGELSAGLARREQPAGWAVTARQELHPDDFGTVRALLDWLATHASDGTGHLRFCEDSDPVPLTLADASIAWPHRYAS